MKKKYISINTINKATEFVKMATTVEGNVTCMEGIYTVNGKSILAIFSIDITNGIIVEYPETATEFDKYITQFEISKVEGN